MAKLEPLTSPANPLVKQARRAIERGGLTSDGYCVAETYHLVEEAFRSGRDVQAVLVSESTRAELERRVRIPGGVRIVILTDALFRDLASTESTQGVMALVRPPEWTLEQALGGQALVMVLDGIQDPGNAGTILRAAEAFGATGSLFLKGSASPYNPKAVRASAGSLFRVPLLAGVDAETALAALQQRGLRIYAASPFGRNVMEEADLECECAIVIGSEGRGVSETWRAAATEVRIPTAGVESLNAALAAGILLYEARRRRSR